MKIILIRHGSRQEPQEIGGAARSTLPDDCQWSGSGQATLDKIQSELHTPLSDDGIQQTDQLAKMFARLNLRPTVYLTSKYVHALQMGEQLAEKLKEESTPRVLPICALTPFSKTDSFEDLIDEASKYGVDLKGRAVVAVIGHEARLSQLLTRLTSQRMRPFNRAEAACISADALQDLLEGKGRVEYRFPVADFQEDALRVKIQSKMLVSTFLAGFTFTALISLIENKVLSAPQVIAVIALTAALSLFIASVYMYDRMAMPEGFWVYGDHSKPLPAWLKKGLDLLLKRFIVRFETDQRQNGLLYSYMVRTWQLVFTPAVLFALAGFIAILLNTNQVVVISGALVVLVLGLVYYVLTRPQLGTD